MKEISWQASTLPFGPAFLETYADRLFFAADMVNKDTVFPLDQWLDDMAARSSFPPSRQEEASSTSIPAWL